MTSFASSFDDVVSFKLACFIWYIFSRLKRISFWIPLIRKQQVQVTWQTQTMRTSYAVNTLICLSCPRRDWEFFVNPCWSLRICSTWFSHLWKSFTSSNKVWHKSILFIRDTQSRMIKQFCTMYDYSEKYSTFRWLPFLILFKMITYGDPFLFQSFVFFT